jgi:hypothetical protein
VAADFPLLPGILGNLSAWGATGALYRYSLLISVATFTAVFSRHATRQDAALEVLRLLLPGRRGRADAPRKSTVTCANEEVDDLQVTQDPSRRLR